MQTGISVISNYIYEPENVSSVTYLSPKANQKDSKNSTEIPTNYPTIIKLLISTFKFTSFANSNQNFHRTKQNTHQKYFHIELIIKLIVTQYRN